MVIFISHAWRHREVTALAQITQQISSRARPQIGSLDQDSTAPSCVSAHGKKHSKLRPSLTPLPRFKLVPLIYGLGVHWAFP